MSIQHVPRLGVNIDHVATLRQARGEQYPGPIEAARVALQNGADQITIHLREDRRHIQDTDLGPIILATREFGKPLNLEMGCAESIVNIALLERPDWVCLVPEKREERTTEGGLNLLDEANYHRILETMEKLRRENSAVKISLFLGPERPILEKAFALRPDAIEIHTGDYARSFLDGEELDTYLELYSTVAQDIRSQGIAVHAGHGLTNESVMPLLKLKEFAEYNIGHWIISQAIFDGLGPVVKKLKDSFIQHG